MKKFVAIVFAACCIEAHAQTIFNISNYVNAVVEPVVTNTTLIGGDLYQTFITNFYDQFTGVNVFTPYLADTNVSGTWTIDLTTNAAVAIYEQVGNITSVVFSVDSTNDVALAEILLLATTNSITWPTNGLTWAAGSEPTPTASEYNRIYFEAWRDYVYAVFVGSNP